MVSGWVLPAASVARVVRVCSPGSAVQRNVKGVHEYRDGGGSILAGDEVAPESALHSTAVMAPCGDRA